MVGYPVFWAVSAFCIVADLVSKWLVFRWVGVYRVTEKSITVIPGFFELRGVKNTGGIWGIGQDIPWLFAVVRFLALFLILYLLRASRRSQAMLHVGLALVFGGAIGNLWDTIVLGGVRDFLEFDLYFMVWPTFNLADSFITIGAAILIVHYFLAGGRGKLEGDRAGIEAL